MDGKTHLTTGILAGAGIVYLESKIGVNVNDLSNVLFISGCALGSLLPDIDIDASMLGRFIPGWIFWEHRTVTHSIFFMLAIGLSGTLLKINVPLNIGLCVGIVTHLVLDSVTPMGLPYLLFPFVTSKPYKNKN